MSIIETKDLCLYYGEKQALKDINMKINKNEVTALIGPSGCGKSTYLRTINRMNEIIQGSCPTVLECILIGQALEKGIGYFYYNGYQAY